MYLNYIFIFRWDYIQKFTYYFFCVFILRCKNIFISLSILIIYLVRGVPPLKYIIYYLCVLPPLKYIIYYLCVPPPPPLCSFNIQLGGSCKWLIQYAIRRLAQYAIRRLTQYAIRRLL